MKVLRKSVRGATKKRKTVTFLHKPRCGVCRKARRYMEKHGYLLHFHDLDKERMSASDLEKLIGKHDHEEFLNPRSDVYRKKKLKDSPPSRREAIRMMAKYPGLIRRPVIVAGGRVVVGYGEDGMIRF